MQRMVRHVLAATAIAVALAGCASQSPPTTSLDYKSRAVTRSDGGLRVSTAVLSAAESEAVYGVPLAGFTWSAPLSVFQSIWPFGRTASRGR